MRGVCWGSEWGVMAIFNTARLMGVLVRGRIAEPERQMEAALAEYGRLDRMEAMEARILQALAGVLAQMAELEAKAAAREAQAAARETRQARHLNQAVGVILGGIAIAVGLIIGLG